MSKPDWQRIAAQLDAHLTRTRMSSQALAVKAGVDRKTIDRLRAGQAVRPQTLQWIEQALHIEFEAQPATVTARVAPAAQGGYRYDAVADYVGRYVAVRRSFDRPGRLIASGIDIQWQDERQLLCFTEQQHNRAATGKAYDYRFGGEIWIPPNLGIMNLVVRSNDGRVRLMSTSMPREQDGTLYMKGFILTLNELRDIGYYPVTSPVFLARLGNGLQVEPGVIDVGDEHHAWAAEILAAIEHKFLPSSL